MSIPKLKLQAAITATRKKIKLLEETYFDIERIYFWNDSKTALKYICNEKKHFTVYVMHRLDQIRSNSNITDWNYIPTHHNVSDACTRPIDFIDFKDNIDYLNNFYKQSKLMNMLEQKKYTTIQISVCQLTNLLSQKLIMLQ